MPMFSLREPRHDLAPAVQKPSLPPLRLGLPFERPGLRGGREPEGLLDLGLDARARGPGTPSPVARVG